MLAARPSLKAIYSRRNRDGMNGVRGTKNEVKAGKIEAKKIEYTAA